MKLRLIVTDEPGNGGWADLEPQPQNLSENDFAINHLLPAYKAAMNAMQEAITRKIR